MIEVVSHLPPDPELVYTSRSKGEQFLDCPRYGYLHNAYGGRGITKRATSVYLGTGSYTHVGMEVIFRNLQAKKPLNSALIDFAVKRAVTKYQEEVSRRGFQLEDGEDKANEQYVLAEQCALVEAFIRCASVRIIPDFISRFRILDVEREEIVQKGNIIIQGRLDVVLEQFDTGDIYIISWKTAAQWDKRQAKANEHDNQGLSETFVLEHRLERDKYSRKTVTGVIMIYMMKGKRYENENIPGRWEQRSPLIKGYRKLIGTTYEYAGSLFYRKEQNKSGWGRLGKGWEPFDVWEDEEVGGVKGWIEKLNRMEAGSTDHIAGSFRVPEPYSRNQRHIDSWLRQTLAKEHAIQSGIQAVNTLVAQGEDLYVALDYHFEQRRKGCHYPNDCEMVEVCFNSEIASDPIGSGKYVWRTPHHKAELAAHQRLYTIEDAPIIVRTSDNVVEINAKRKPEVISVQDVSDEPVIEIDEI